MSAMTHPPIPDETADPSTSAQEAAREPSDAGLLAEIIEHFAANDWRPGDDWAFPDDESSLCLDHRLPDGTKFWLDIEKDGIVIYWRPPDAAARTLRLAARRLEASPSTPFDKRSGAQGEISEAMVEAVRQRLRERGYTEISHFVIGLVLRHAAALSGKEE